MRSSQFNAAHAESGKDLNPALIDERRAVYRDCRRVLLEYTGHMVHLERSERLAEVVKAFLAD